MKKKMASRWLLPAFRRGVAPRVLYGPVLLLVLLAAAPLVQGQSAHPTQDDVEAVYLYNFAKFVHWPAAEQQQPLNICVLGQDPFGPTLDRILANELIDGRHLAAVQLPNTATAQTCSILFISRSESPRLREVLSSLAALPVMTVSDMPDFADRGGMVQFLLQDNRVRFEVNLDAADKVGLVLSSQLLKVAARVMGKPQGGVAR